MIKKIFFYLCVIVLSIGCIKKYKFTSKICKGKLYAENFNVNPAGVNEVYLTDSLSFRLYVGQYDSEHENFNFTCNADSVIVKKITFNDITGKVEILQTKTYNLNDLVKMKNF